MKLARALAAVILIAAFAPRCAAAAEILTGDRAFILLNKVPPGESLDDAVKFLGAHASERTIDAKLGMKVRTWDVPAGKWALDMLHDGERVRATRVRWTTSSNGERSVAYAQLTSAGKKQFGRLGKYSRIGSEEAMRWVELSGGWLIVASRSPEGVSLLYGIRGGGNDSAKYGF